MLTVNQLTGFGANANQIPAADGILRSPNNMTSNTTPSPFVASASNEFDANARAYKAFDGSNADYPSGSFYGGYPAGTVWLQIQLDQPRWIASYSIRNRGNTADTSPKDFILDGSNDGSSWTLVDSRGGVSWASSSLEKTFAIADGSRGQFLYWRLTVTAIQGAGGVGISEFKLYS